jgi:hypothetical protein
VLAAVIGFTHLRLIIATFKPALHTARKSVISVCAIASTGPGRFVDEHTISA